MLKWALMGSGNLMGSGLKFSYIRSSRIEMLPELSYLRANIRLIGGDWNLCFYITVDNELYYVNYTSRYQLELIFVAKKC